MTRCDGLCRFMFFFYIFLLSFFLWYLLYLLYLCNYLSLLHFSSNCMFKDSSLNVLLCYSPFVFGFALVLMAQQLFVQPI